jgi:hypothetical protein
MELGLIVDLLDGGEPDVALWFFFDNIYSFFKWWAFRTYL